MREQANLARDEFEIEYDRLEAGCTLLVENAELRQSFQIANEAILHSARGKYEGWRPFQLAFLISCLASLVDPADSEVVDTVWFATGGGKTETYLGLLVTAIIFDRLSGKLHGISAWSRFPLRMLSLQQTQRFADALAGAELARRRHAIPGATISLGFFVGEGGTPNKINIEPTDGQPDSLDATMPAKFQVLLRCPFCASTRIGMDFDRATWSLVHVCENETCQWDARALPFYVVDQEIFRFLPSVVVGTLDKAALVSMQAAMRGFFGPPLGVCSKPGHGYTYSPRKATPSGCLVPGCRGAVERITQDASLWAPRLRLQDELHLLRDSLGAVDSHYETLLDHLQSQLGAPRAKIIASSATLTGAAHQIDVLYRRGARVFPQPGPSVSESFWSEPSDQLARRYIGIAPRGVTMEFLSDRTLTVLQECVRALVDSPEDLCRDLAIPLAHASHLISQYGVDVVYGNTVRDVEAARRSTDNQIPFPVNTETLTGATQFDDVRRTLERLENPEKDFYERIHIVAASSMISHGVDVDRLNLMVMLGLPLTTAEFIQTSARVGRRWPGLVYVAHRLTREREAGIFGQFEKFVSQGDRFVEAIPITRGSRRVLALTTAGVVEARRLAIHEPAAREALTTVRKLRDYFSDVGVTEDTEFDAVVEALRIERPIDDLMRGDLRVWLANYFSALNDPATQVIWPSELSPSGPPMRSLRDVEASVPVVGQDAK
jgi:hypothetical protein